MRFLARLPVFTLFLLVGLAACNPFTAPDGSDSEFQPPGPSLSISQDQISLVDLGTLGGATSEGVAINELGQVTGNSELASGERHAFLWESGSGMTDLGTLGGVSSEAAAISDLGHVVGQSPTSAGNRHAFLWETGSSMTDLGTLGGVTSRAVDVNDQGQIVGTSSIANNLNHAFLWESGSGMIDLGTLGGDRSFGVALNASGQVVGESFTTESTVPYAFFWESGSGITDIGSVAGHNHSFAEGINDQGQVIARTSVLAFVWESGAGSTVLEGPGSSSSSDVPVAINNEGEVAGWSFDLGNDAIRWESKSAPAQVLGDLGGNFSQATDINDNGQIVGFSRTAAGVFHAFIWESGSGMTDLGALGGATSRAVDINNSGQIVGFSKTSTGDRHAVVWTVQAGGITVDLDIKPASDENPIEINVPGTIPVASLSDSEFDAPASVDAATLTFGQTGDEESLAHLGNGDPQCGTEDVNGDSLDDLVCHFYTQKTGFEIGDTEGVLRGETTDDTALEGTDLVWILN